MIKAQTTCCVGHKRRKYLSAGDWSDYHLCQALRDEQNLKKQFNVEETM